MTTTTVNRSTSRRLFTRPFAELLIALLLGMGVAAGLASLAFAGGGSSSTDQPGCVPGEVMGLGLTVPMVRCSE